MDKGKEPRFSPELKEKINNHEILFLPKDERLDNKRLYCDMLDLLLCGCKRVPDPSLLAAAFSKGVAGSAGDEDDDPADTDTDPYAPLADFDGIAFINAANNAIKYYDRDRGAAFTTFFEISYRQKLGQEGLNKKYGHMKGVSENYRRLLYIISCNMSQRGMDISRLSSDDIEELSRDLGISQDKLNRCLLLLKNEYELSLNTPADDDSGSECIDLVSDRKDPYNASVDKKALIQTLCSIIDLMPNDALEWPRLFWTNDILREIVEEQDSSSSSGFLFLDVCLAAEDMLWDKVFDADYIGFVFKEPPVPDTIGHILQARQIKQLSDVSIAEFRGCSKANVSQQRHGRNKNGQWKDSIFARLQTAVYEQLTAPEDV